MNGTLGRHTFPAVGALAALAAAFAPAGAQVGAFGGTSGGVAGTGVAHHAAPLLAESGVMPLAGTWNGRFLGGVTRFSDGPASLSIFGSAGALAYAASDDLVVGAAITPWIRRTFSDGIVSVSTTGRGDAALFGKYRFHRSGDGRTAGAVSASVGLPIGEEGFGTTDMTIGVAAALTRQLEQASFHGAAGVHVPTDDLDGETVLSLVGAAMFAVGERVSVGGELRSEFSNGEHVVDLLPGFRYQVGEKVFLDGGVLVNLATSLVTIHDWGLFLGLHLAGG